jgi:hypothetical protein
MQEHILYSGLKHIHLYITSPQSVKICVGKIGVDFKETECEGVEWIQLAQDSAQWQALVNIVLNLQDP